MHLKMSFAKYSPSDLGFNKLTHWGWHKMSAISQTTFKHVFLENFRISFKKIIEICCHAQLRTCQHWFRPLLEPKWWHGMITSLNGNIFCVSGHLCAGNFPITGKFPLQRPGTRGFDIFFDLRLNKRLSKQSRPLWFETPSLSVWRHCMWCRIIKTLSFHGDAMIWKRFPHYWHFCVGKPAANGGLLSQRPIMRSFDVLLVVSLNKLLNTITLRSFETPSLMWHHSIVQIDIFRFKWGIIVSNDILKSNESIWGQLTYLPRTKWPPFWQTTISNAFFWMKMIEFRFEFVWNSFPGFQLTIASIGSLTHIYGTRERWVVNSLIFRETSYSEDRSWWFTSTIFTPQIPVMLPLTHWGPHKLVAIWQTAFSHAHFFKKRQSLHFNWNFTKVCSSWLNWQ